MYKFYGIKFAKRFLSINFSFFFFFNLLNKILKTTTEKSTMNRHVGEKNKKGSFEYGLHPAASFCENKMEMEKKTTDDNRTCCKKNARR